MRSPTAFKIGAKRRLSEGEWALNDEGLPFKLAAPHTKNYFRVLEPVQVPADNEIIVKVDWLKMLRNLADARIINEIDRVVGGPTLEEELAEASFTELATNHDVIRLNRLGEILRKRGIDLGARVHT